MGSGGRKPRGEGLATPLQNKSCGGRFLSELDAQGYNAVYGHYVDRVTADGSLGNVAADGASMETQFPLECDVSTLGDRFAAQKPGQCNCRVATKAYFRG